MRNAILILVCAAFNLSSSYSQNQQCAVLPGNEDNHRLIRNISIANENAMERDDHQFVPINFIITTDDNGIGAIKESKIIDALCKLNELYEPVGLKFYIGGPIDYLASSILYDQSPLDSSERDIIYSDNKRDSTINVFIGNTSFNYSGYYHPTLDIIFIRKKYVNSIDVVLAHEVGHYLSLRHTFYGWESVSSFDPIEPTPEQLVFDGQTINVEYVDRNINCEEAADLMCDTPADYIRDWSGGCNYTGGAVDPDGVLLDPDERNIMAYYSFAECSEYVFSENQVGAMLVDYTFRTEISSLQEPNIDLVTEAPQGIYPINGEIVDENDDLQFSWTEVENADLYVVEFCPNNMFIVISRKYIVDQPTFTLTDLDLSVNYYWRVRAVKHTNLCEEGGMVSDLYDFEAKDLVSIEDNSWQEVNIYPNPTNGFIFLIGITLEDKDIRITSVFGQNMLFKINTGNNSIDVNDVPSGTYMLSIRSEESNVTKKITVL